MTFLRYADSCLHSALLYTKHRGGAPSMHMQRGSAFHAVAERMTLALVEQGESSLFAAQPGEDAAVAAREVASLSSAFVDEVLRERTDLHVSTGEADAIRVMAFHWAAATVLDPNRVIGVEQKFVADVGGREVSGIIDLALAGPQDGLAEIVDYKTSFYVPEAESYRQSFQPRFYAFLLMHGFPVRKVDGVEVRDPSLGDRTQWVTTREVYPRYLSSEGNLRERDHVLSRTDVAQFRGDLERLIERVERAAADGEWPAVLGDHCSVCPARAECPITDTLRSWAGEVNTPEQAREAAAWADVQGERVAATNKELKAWANRNGPIRYGKDLVRDFVLVESRSVKKKGGKSDWEGLSEAVFRAAEFGEPFQLGEWVKESGSTNFKRRVLSAEELAEEQTDDE